jgi:hypothetical protein
MINEITRHLQAIVDRGIPVMKYFKGRDKDASDAESFCVGIIGRFVDVSLAVKALLKFAPGFESAEYSIGLLIRSCLLDSLTASNLHVIKSNHSKKTPEELKTEIDNFCFDAVQEGVRFVITSSRSALRQNFITAEEFASTLRLLKKAYSRFFKPSVDGTDEPQLLDKKSGHKFLSNKMKSHDVLHQIPGAINDLYNIYSKYEHFNDMYWTVLNRPIPEKERHILKSIEMISFAQTVIIQTLSDYHPNDAFLGRHAFLATEDFNKEFLVPRMKVGS